jgi:peptidyl-prolyl cis-trans isomerase D
MISWLQTTFQKHIKVVLGLLLIAVIVPFVFTIGAAPGIGQGDRKVKSIELFGRPFSSEVDRETFFADAQVSYYLTSGQPYYDSSQIQMHAFSRGASLQIAERLGIPAPTGDQVTDFIRTLPAFAGQDGTFDADAYARFRDDIAGNPEISQARIARVLAQDWRISQIGKLLGGPGYVLRNEVEQGLARADTRWSVATATLDVSTVPAPAAPDEAELKAWFDSNSARYRIPERAKVSFVRFSAERYADRVSPTDDEIVRYFEQNKARYTPPAPAVAEGETPPPPAEVTLGDVRERVVQDVVAARSRTLAEKAAADFAYMLFDEKITPGTEPFQAVVSGAGLRLESPQPFAAGQVPPGTGWTPQISSEAFRLNERRPVSDPLTAGNDAFVVFFEERIPASDADFFAVRDRVLADVTANKRNEAVAARGRELTSTIAAAVKSGTSFVEAAKAAGLETNQWEDFSLRDLPEDIDYGVLGRLEELPVAEVSPMAVQGNRGVITIVTSRKAPEISAETAAFEEARTTMMQQGAMMTSQGLLGQIVRDELDRSGLARDSE